MLRFSIVSRLIASLTTALIFIAPVAAFARTNQEALCGRPVCTTNPSVCPGGATECRSTAEVKTACGGDSVCLNTADSSCMQLQSCREAQEGQGYPTAGTGGGTGTGGTAPVGNCCACQYAAGTQTNRGFFRITDATNCANFTQSATILGTRSAGDFQGITCEQAASCQDPQDPSHLYDLLHTQPTAPTAASTPSAPQKPFQSITPVLGVPIPGLVFTPATKDSNNNVAIPFLPQYISAVYRYAIGIVGLVATIMVVYGGFRYLLGSVSTDFNRGKEIITDAIAGFLLVLVGYALLATINSDTVDLQSLSLGNVNEVISENVDVVPDTTPDAPTLSSCFTNEGATPQTKQSGDFTVIPIQPYFQYAQPWRFVAFAPSIKDNVAAVTCQKGSDGKNIKDANGNTVPNGCWGKIGSDGCGVTSLAVVLASYGYTVTDPGRSAVCPNCSSSSEGSHLFDPVDAAKFAARIGAIAHHNGSATDPVLFTHLSHIAPFTTTSLGSNTSRAAQYIRSGYLVPFLCHGCTVTYHGNPKRYGGHYMVLHGVNADASIFKVQDVGGRAGSEITADELRSNTSGMWAIQPQNEAGGLQPNTQKGSCSQ